MRVALISDIHGNTVALDAVLSSMQSDPPDRIVCLGDVAAGGPDPTGAIERLIAIGCETVQGNTDAGLVTMPDWWRDPASIGLPEQAFPGMDITVWSSEQLHSDHRHYLDALPLTSRVELGTAGSMLAFHGSPRSADDYISATTKAEDLDQMFAGHSENWLVGGHTHVPLIRSYGTRTIANPGSVGMPFVDYGYAGGVPVLAHAAYGMLSTTADRVRFELRQVAVDQERLRQQVERSDMPHAEWWLGIRQSTDH